MHSILHYTTSSWVQLDWAFRTPIALDITKTPWTNEKLFEGRMEWIPNGDYLQEELIYSGKSGQTLKAIYREFIGDFVGSPYGNSGWRIKQGFTQELQYDLDSSSIIGFRSLQIEIVEATNSSITFKVISDDGL